VRFLTSAFSIKLEDLADEWFVSRATLQSDMAEVRERFQRYQLTLETRPRHGHEGCLAAKYRFAPA
jgi:transcriptional antiterminator